MPMEKNTKCYGDVSLLLDDSSIENLGEMSMKDRGNSIWHGLKNLNKLV